MTPFFNPGTNPYGHAEVFLAAVGEMMTEVAGEICDGIICHGFTTERYLREVTLPALERGPRQGRQAPSPTSRSRMPGLRGHRHHRGGDGRPRPRACVSRSPSTARRPPTAACSSRTAGATSSPS